MKKTKKIHNILTRVRKKDGSEREVKLWRAVILQAAEDALITSRKKKKLKVKLDAIYWLKNSKKDIKEVCAFADVRYEKIKALTEKIFD
ncbi:MAG TPA: hypothetical protein DIV86_03095 [Alphaproteobacteria bacterium]|nr:hypothetical protein [Alphaproteobacteria bacterium]